MVEKSEIGAGVPDVWSQLWGPFRHLGRQVGELFAPSSEASGGESAYEIKVELPGVADKDIAVEVRQGRLTVSGRKEASTEQKGAHYYFSERAYGAFERSFRLPEDADVDAIAADHRDGLLTVRIPRKSAQDGGPKRVAING